MPIDFHAPANRFTYAGRSADESWRVAMRELADPSGAAVVDVGCGGGIYSRAWLELGAATVTGVDFSAEMLAAAREGAADGLRFVQGGAAATGLLDGSADIVFERALVHHVADLGAVAREARRVLRPGGTYIVQDRTAEDVRQPAGPEHVRGYLFERFPRLLDVELRRRPQPEAMRAALGQAGFGHVATRTLWEVRRVHPSRDAYLAEIRSRTGRSILHELSDAELGALVDHLRVRLQPGEVEERDRWTLWTSRPTAR
jgi:ubiquinone/menaquinone biosynthesis C-methylase UbiE